MNSDPPKRKRGRPRKQAEESDPHTKRVMVELRKDDFKGERWIACMECHSGISGAPGVIMGESSHLILCANCLWEYSCYHCEELSLEKTAWFLGSAVNSCKKCALQVLRDLEEKAPKQKSMECAVCKSWNHHRTEMVETIWGHVCARCIPRCKEELANLNE